jgi:hypothetical protein
MQDKFHFFDPLTGERLRRHQPKETHHVADDCNPQLDAPRIHQAHD